MLADDVVKRLEDAGRTILMLPRERAQGHVRPTAWDMLEPGLRHIEWEGRPLRLTPEPRAIDAMDEAFRWLALIPQERFVMRRIVAARCLVHPLTDRHLFAWRRLGTLLGADHKAIQRWHGQGVDYIVTALAQQRRRAA